MAGKLDSLKNGNIEEVIQAHLIRLAMLIGADGVPFEDANPIPVYASTGGSAASAGMDAFFRQRVSSPFVLSDHKQVVNDLNITGTAEHFPLWWNNQEISGTGTATAFDVNRASTTLSVSNLTAGGRVRSTKQRINYQPGKSILMFITGIVGTTPDGIEKTWGLFDEDNGVFFYKDSSGVGVGVRSNVTGSPVDTKVGQADWNINTLDGTDPDKPVMDTNQALIYFVDLEWLGVGTVAFGVVINRKPYYLHFAHHANLIASVYMSTPNLPVTWKIENDGTGPAASIEQVCTTVMSEGGVDPGGVNRGQNMGVTEITLPAAGTTYALCGIRLKTGFIGSLIDLTDISAIATSANDNFLVSLHWNPTLATDFVWADMSNSAIQFGTAVGADPPNNQITLSDAGEVIRTEYVSAQQRIANPTVQSNLKLGADYTKTIVDSIILSITPLDANVDCLASMNWRESW